jgi:FtsH-binding integral membrane protein
MSRVRLTTGILWVVLPLIGFADLLIELNKNAFDNWPRFVPVFGAFLALTACGLYFLLGWPGAKWVLRVAATLSSVYVLFGIMHSVDHGPDWIALAFPIALVTFGVFSVAVAGRA